MKSGIKLTNISIICDVQKQQMHIFKKVGNWLLEDGEVDSACDQYVFPVRDVQTFWN